MTPLLVLSVCQSVGLNISTLIGWTAMKPYTNISGHNGEVLNLVIVSTLSYSHLANTDK